MCDESNFTMDKRVPVRQTQYPTRNNGERKSDYVANKNGRTKKHRDGSNGGRSQDAPQQMPRPGQKYARGGFSDKRPQPRGCFDSRQSEEVAEPYDLDDFLTSRKSKGNANGNHLLNFLYPSTSNISRGATPFYGSRRKSYGPPTPSYKKEQYLQASCQFIVKGGGDYSKQAIDPDALVDWDDVQLVRTFSSEFVCCPICLDVPVAAKITRCGHTYCWGCILHYLHVNNSDKHATCPVCPEKINSEKLRSVQNVTVPDFKVGDEIEMKLMRKSKGSVFVCPEEEWSGVTERHLNMNHAGTRTKFSKLLLASWQQIKTDVIDVEKEALSRALKDAEPDEVIFLEMAQSLLEKREVDFQFDKNCNFDPKEMERELDVKQGLVKKKVSTVEAKSEAGILLPPDVSFDGSKINTVYTDAFDDEERDQSSVYVSETSDNEQSSEMTVLNLNDVNYEEEKEQSEAEARGDTETIKRLASAQGSPLVNLQDSLSPEEAVDHLELPDVSSTCPRKPQGNRPKDTYHFYQASGGQHIYMHSLNTQCLTREYGSLENSPKSITATIVAMERIFMTEEMRKRLRYLNHIPLTTEFRVVELKIKPPVVSKETLKHFQPDFDKRRKLRQKKAKEDKIRANKNEVIWQKAHGLYMAPEVHIPLDNTTHFPSHLASCVGPAERQRKESANSDIFSDTGSGTNNGPGSPVSTSPNQVEKLATSPSFASFAQKLRGTSISGTSPPAWPRMSTSLVHSATMPEMSSHPVSGAQGHDEPDNEEAYNAPSMASAWLSSLHDLSTGQEIQALDGHASAGGKKKKKREKQVLFSTSMARKH